jgi:hypothetical protein
MAEENAGSVQEEREGVRGGQQHNVLRAELAAIRREMVERFETLTKLLAEQRAAAPQATGGLPMIPPTSSIGTPSQPQPQPQPEPERQQSDEEQEEAEPPDSPQQQPTTAKKPHLKDPKDLHASPPVVLTHLEKQLLSRRGKPMKLEDTRRSRSAILEEGSMDDELASMDNTLSQDSSSGDGDPFAQLQHNDAGREAVRLAKTATLWVGQLPESMLRGLSSQQHGISETAVENLASLFNSNEIVAVSVRRKEDSNGLRKSWALVTFSSEEVAMAVLAEFKCVRRNVFSIRSCCALTRLTPK